MNAIIKFISRVIYIVLGFVAIVLILIVGGCVHALTSNCDCAPTQVNRQEANDLQSVSWLPQNYDTRNS